MDPLAQRGMKVFGIGLQKTGTSSLEWLLRDRRIKCDGRNQRMHKLFLNGQYEEILAHYDTLTHSSDWPTPLMYKLVYNRYGKNVKFILTVRDSSRTWIESLKRHGALSHPFKNKHKWTFKRYYPFGFENEHVAYYERHNQEVVNFLKRNDAEGQLLILEAGDPKSITKIEQFLDLSFDVDEMPHINRSAGKSRSLSKHITMNLNRIILPIYAYLAPKVTSKVVEPVYEADPERHRI